MNLSRYLTALFLVLSGPVLADSATTAESKEIRRLLSRQQFDEAMAKAEEVVEKTPASAEAQYWLGAAYGQKAGHANMFSAARYAGKVKVAFEQAIALEPKHIEANLGLMQFYLQAPGIMGGDKEEARKIADRLATISPADGHQAKALLATVAHETAVVIEEVRAGLKINPAHPALVSMAVGNLLEKKDFPAAQAVVEAAVAHDASSGPVQYQYAKVAAVSGQHLETGLSYLDALIALPERPENVPEAGMYWRRGQILEKLGRKDDALAAYQLCAKIAPEFEEVKADLTRLRKS